VPLVLLVAEPADERWDTFPAFALSLDATAEAVTQALRAVARGERPRATKPRREPPVSEDEGTAVAAAPASTASLLTVWSGPGSPGRTTLAINLAAALGAVAPTILVDADLAGPSVAARVDLDPTRNLYMLAHAEPTTAREWARAIEQEVQPLAARSPHGAALCGVPKREMRAAITGRFLGRLLAELRPRYRHVILDVGAEAMGAEGAAHRAALRAADQVLLLAAADLVGLWHARAALTHLRTHLQVEPERVALVVNRHDRRFHHARAEIEWALGAPTAAVLPWDYRAAQCALSTQQPVVLQGSGRLARGLLDLAERVHRGRIELPPARGSTQPSVWLRGAAALRRVWPRRGQRTDSEQGISHAGHVASPR
jgi:Flp pilus assembly CpaE family ATPase